MAGFDDIFDKLTWTMFKMSEGNPYLIHDLVQKRNKERENQGGKTR